MLKKYMYSHKHDLGKLFLFLIIFITLNYNCNMTRYEITFT